MFTKSFLLQLSTIIAAFTPLSVIFIHIFNKLFSRYNPELGKTTVICTDTKGILIKNALIVKNIFFDQYKVTVRDKDSLIDILNLETNENFSVEKTFLNQEAFVQLMAVASHLCHYEKTEEIENIINGFLKKCAIGTDRTNLNYTLIEKIPTNDEKKLSTVVVSKNDPQEIFSFSKGNFKTILNRCSKILLKDKKVELNQQLRRKMIKKAEKLHKKGQKTIAFAFKALPKKRFEHYSEEFTENDLTFIGTITLFNPINTELIPYIEKAKQNNLKIYILTKLNEKKALAIAEELKIINPNYVETITGEYLKDFSDQKLTKMLLNKEKDFVFANMREEDKLRIYKTLKDLKETVAIANRERNSFKEIGESIEENFAYQENRKKIFVHSFICKIAEIFTTIISLILSFPLPLTLSLILLIELGINLPAEISLRMNKTTELFTKTYFYTIINGLILSIILITLFYFTLLKFGWESGDFSSPFIIKAQTTIFFIVAIYQILNAFFLRSPEKSLFSLSPFKNIYLILTTIISILIIYAILIIPQSKDILGLTSLSFTEWMLIIFFITVLIIIEETRKIIHKKLSKSKLKNEPANPESAILADKSNPKQS